MIREANAPELPTSDDVSVAVDNVVESDAHRRRTVVGVDTGKVEVERAIAFAKRWRRWERWLWGGAIAGYAAFLIELWRFGR